MLFKLDLSGLGFVGELALFCEFLLYFFLLRFELIVVVFECGDCVFVFVEFVESELE